MAREMKDSGVEWIGYIPCPWETLPIHSAFVERREKVSDIEWEPLSVTKSGVVKQLEHAAKSNNHNDRKKVCIGDFAINSRSDRKESCGLSSMDGSVSLINTVLIPNDSLYSLEYVKYLLKNYGFAEEFYRWGTGIVADLWSTNFERMKNIKLPLPPLSEQQKIADFLDEKVKEIDNAIEKTKETIELYKKYKQAIITEAVTKGLDPNVEMKDSGIEWVSRIPHNWKTMRIANLYFERSENGNDNLPILLVSINVGITDHEPDETEMVKKTIRSEDKTKYKVVHPNDLVYNMMRAWQGAFGCARVDGMVSPAYVIVQPKCRIDSRYFEALLRTNEGKEEVNSFSYGVADFRKRLYWNKFRNIKVPVPPLEEQKEISNFIDNVTSKIDELIESKQALINKLVQYKKSVIYEYVTGKKEVK